MSAGAVTEGPHCLFDLSGEARGHKSPSKETCMWAGELTAGHNQCVSSAQSMVNILRHCGCRWRRVSGVTAHYLLPLYDNGQVHIFHCLCTEERSGEPLEILAHHTTDVFSTGGHAWGIGMHVMLAEADCSNACCPFHHRVSLCSNGLWAQDRCLDISALTCCLSPFGAKSLIVVFEFYVSVTDITGIMTKVMAYGWDFLWWDG